MDIQVFLNNYREAFGDKVDLPIVFGYSEQPVTAASIFGAVAPSKISVFTFWATAGPSGSKGIFLS